MNRVLVTIVALLGLTILRGEDQGGCDSSIVGDPTFDLWCSKTLCAWTTEQGEIRRVSTWHRSDYGVDMVGDPVVISQLAKGGLGSCLELRVQADHDDGVNLFLELDFFNDKSIDHSIQMGSDDYRPVVHHLVPPRTGEPVRFVVRKTGAGRAVLAEIKIKSVGSSECEGLAPLQLKDLQEGVPCSVDAECSANRCQEVVQFRLNTTGYTEQVCSGCDIGGYCPSGKICGLDWTTSASKLHQACVLKGARSLGERCAGADECGSGICCENVCSECCAGDDAACAADQSCALRSWQSLGSDFQFIQLPHQCSPGGQKGKAGAACLADGDCVSGSCTGSGALKVCLLDGRTCKEDDDCPLTKCLPLGQAKGACQ